MLRLITDGKISPEEAVHAYSTAFFKDKGIKPRLPIGKKTWC